MIRPRDSVTKPARRLTVRILYAPSPRSGRPPLILKVLRPVVHQLSHEPLTEVPVGAVNVHGHLHDGTEPTRRHVNVAVERWNYEPVPMATVAARALGRWK